MDEEPPAKNGNHTKAVAKLLNQLNLPTLALILLTGGGNWFATKETGNEQREELGRAIRQIEDLHAALAQTEARQKEALENLASLMRGQTAVFSNQLEVLKKIDQSAPKQP